MSAKRVVGLSSSYTLAFERPMPMIPPSPPPSCLRLRRKNHTRTPTMKRNGKQVFDQPQNRCRARIGARHLDLVVEEKRGQRGVVEGNRDLRGVGLAAGELAADSAGLR